MLASQQLSVMTGVHKDGSIAKVVGFASMRVQSNSVWSRPENPYLTGEKYESQATTYVGGVFEAMFKLIMYPPRRLSGRLINGESATAVVSWLKDDDRKYPRAVAAWTIRSSMR